MKRQTVFVMPINTMMKCFIMFLLEGDLSKAIIKYYSLSDIKLLNKIQDNELWQRISKAASKRDNSGDYIRF